MPFACSVDGRLLRARLTNALARGSPPRAYITRISSPFVAEKPCGPPASIAYAWAVNAAPVLLIGSANGKLLAPLALSGRTTVAATEPSSRLQPNRGTLPWPKPKPSTASDPGGPLLIAKTTGVPARGQWSLASSTGTPALPAQPMP